MHLKSPNGRVMTGIAQLVNGTALISDNSFFRRDDGKFGFEFAGGTEMDWNSQKDVLANNGQRIFVDEVGDYWVEEHLSLVSETQTVPLDPIAECLAYDDKLNADERVQDLEDYNHIIKILRAAK